MDTRNPDVRIGKVMNGFKVEKAEIIDSLKIVFYQLSHEKTGSRMIHISSEDDNNVFMVTLATHPEDSTGAAHILEHGVLEGSKNYPVKIFKNLSGRSLNTFLNAMTGSDYTAYPYASRNKVDFFNLMDLYMDAVFFPIIDRETFLQEGWRYEFAQPDNPETPLEFKGVVFNEMKGAMGNPVRLFHEYLRKAIFPDLTYRVTSGGDPKHIPDLNYEDWVAFHKKFYHPSNAVFFTYGDIPLEDLTGKISDKVLSKFDRAQAADPIPKQKAYSEPTTIRYTFPMSKSEDPRNKSFVALLWKLIPITEFYENLKLSLLDTVLTGSSSSILNRTLMESGLGSGLAPAGFDTNFSESIFGAGLKDVDENKASEIEELILNTLKKVRDEGLDKAETDAAIHEMEFNSREIKGDHGVPFGLSLAFRGLKMMLEGGDFELGLKIDKYLDQLRQDAQHPDFFKTLIDKYLLKNTHRITMILAPDPGGMEQQEIDRRERLDSYKDSLSKEDQMKLVAQAKALLAHQNEEGNTSCLPQIKIDEISVQPDSIPQAELSVSGTRVFKHPVPTNGINYLTLAFEKPFTESIHLDGIQFAGIITELGAGNSDYIEVGRKIRELTGGISVSASTDRNIKTGNHKIDLRISGRCLPRNSQAMIDLISDIVLKPDLSNNNRISELLNLQKAYAVPMASYNGHIMASLAVSRWFCPMRWVGHHVSGMAGIQRLLDITPEKIEGIITRVLEFIKSMSTLSNLNVCVTGDEHLNDEMLSHLNKFTTKLPENSELNPEGAKILTNTDPVIEAWVLSTDVSYVAKAFPAVHFEHPDASALEVLSALMERPMYELIRAQGGAYGAFSQYNSNSGIFTMMTYRDPHTAQSLEAFDQVISNLAEKGFNQEKLDHAIVNVIAHMDKPPSPREKGLIQFQRTLNGITLEDRRKMRENILKTDREDIMRVLEKYLMNPEKTAVAMVTSDKILQNEESRSLNAVRKSLDD